MYCMYICELRLAFQYMVGGDSHTLVLNNDIIGNQLWRNTYTIIFTTNIVEIEK